MDKRKLRYARKKTKERILWQRSRRASQGSGQDSPQTQQEEKQVSPENYAEPMRREQGCREKGFW